MPTVTRVENLPDSVAWAYLDLLEVDVERGAVDAEALRALQRAHVEHVPYETVDIVMGRPPGIDPIASARRIVGRRGGYCYHLNGAFSSLLAWLGVDITRHRGGVQNRTLADPVGANGNHLALTARTRDGDEWLVDVGLGDGPAEPIRLVEGEQEQAGYRYRLGPSTCGAGLWRFEHDARGSFAGFDFEASATGMGVFTEMHAELSTNSGFARTVTAQRRVGDRVEVLRGCIFSELTPSDERSIEITNADDWWDVLTGRFGLAYADLPSDERARLWQRVVAGHDAWKAAGGS